MYNLSLEFISLSPKSHFIGDKVRFKLEITNKSTVVIEDKWLEIGINVSDTKGDYKEVGTFTVYISKLEPGESTTINSPSIWEVDKKEFNVELTLNNVFSENKFKSNSINVRGEASINPDNHSLTNSIIDKTQSTFYTYMGFSALALGALTALTVWKVLIQPAIESHKESLSYNTEQSRKFYILLAKIQALTNADRVILMQSYLEGNTRSEVTLKPTHEVVSQGIEYCSQDIGVINTFCVSQIIDTLSNKELKFRIGQFAESPVYKNFLENLGVLGTCSYLLESNDIPLGILILHYCKDVDIMSKTNLKLIESACRELTNLLSKKRTGFINVILDLLIKLSPF